MKHIEKILNQSIRNLEMTAEDLESLKRSQEVASFFVDVAMLLTASEYLREQQWLCKKRGLNFQDFLSRAWTEELKEVSFLRERIEESLLTKGKELSASLINFRQTCIDAALRLPFEQQKIFAEICLTKMAKLFKDEAQFVATHSDPEGLFGISLYRSFDGLDEVFGINYAADHGMRTDLKISERLYEGAGIGVQSSYSTLLNALRVIQPSQGSRFIDLGSGYGRVGFVVGLMRPDIDFIGYEYVPHRVEIADEISKNYGLNQHVHFQTQDLSDVNFIIPEAEVYYMYDPFSEDTYRHVVNQLFKIAKNRQITIVTKGNAQAWLKKAAAIEGWLPGEQYDGDSLSFYRSPVL